MFRHVTGVVAGPSDECGDDRAGPADDPPDRSGAAGVGGPARCRHRDHRADGGRVRHQQEHRPRLDVGHDPGVLVARRGPARRLRHCRTARGVAAGAATDVPPSGLTTRRSRHVLSKRPSSRHNKRSLRAPARSWLAWAVRCRIPAFVELGRRIRTNLPDIEAGLLHDLSNALIESTNTKLRLLPCHVAGSRNRRTSSLSGSSTAAAAAQPCQVAPPSDRPREGRGESR